MELVESKLNLADPFTREDSMNDLRPTNKYYYMIWDKFGPFKYDIMASATNVKCDEKGNKLRFFSRFFQQGAKGWMCFPKT